MKCLACGKGTLTRKQADMPYTYKNQTTTIHDVMGDHCDHCKEVVMDFAEGMRVTEEMLNFNKKVNADTVDPLFIVSVRKKLKLNQQEAAEIFGGGVNAFSRYEKGTTIPPLALLKLFKILDKHPNLLSEINELPTIREVNHKKKVKVRIPATKAIRQKAKELPRKVAAKKPAKAAPKKKVAARKRA